MKVLHVTPWFMPAYCYGGPVESVYWLGLNLARNGCEVKVLTTDANGPGQRLQVDSGHEQVIAPGFSVRYCLRTMGEAVSLALVRNLMAYVRWADVVHLAAIYSFPSIPTLMACRIARKPLIWSPHGALQRWSGSRRLAAKFAWETVCRALMPPATVLHVTAAAEQRDSLARFPRQSIALVPNGVTIPREVTHRTGDGTPRLGFIGRLNAKKGIENLIQACGLLRDAGKPVKLLIAGEGEERYRQSLAELVARRGLGGQVEMLGQVMGDGKRRFFEGIDLAVFPSHTENFGIVVAEALAHGVAVVASTGTPWARIEEIGCGRWVDNDPPALADALKRMLSAPLREMGQRGRQWMCDEFSWGRIAGEMYRVYQRMVSAGPSAQPRSSINVAANPAPKLNEIQPDRGFFR